MKFYLFVAMAMAASLIGCSHGKLNDVSAVDAARVDHNYVRDAVVFEPGTQDGAVVPEISAPRLRAIWVPERIDGNRLIEAHREWALEGEVSLLGIPLQKRISK